MTKKENFDSVHERTKRKLVRDMGPVLLEALQDPMTIEVMLNPGGKLWQEKLGEPQKCIGTLREAQAQAIIENVAGFHRKIVTRDESLLEGEFPLDGSRFAGQLPPTVTSPTFAIRKKASKIFALTEYVRAGVMTEAQKEKLEWAVKNHRNILVVGGTGSGKTTLVNAIIHEMVEENPIERLIIIEDTGEIQCAAENHVQYHTSISVDMTMLLRTTLRMRPDRILVGEVRGEEALDLLDAWNTGHPGGVATLHANSAGEGLSRLKSLVSRNKSAPAEIEPLIAEAVHVLVFITKVNGKEVRQVRRVQEIIEVSGYRNGEYQTSKL
ncbi:MAG: P-type conjugative transfer ATPase TrbB [Candidatus Thiodiazotropha sp. (ex Dulcina madagascariensis)]|nr:P-type conjugative transfer ATPase TrbB [Candidatus Thiodiazotropha sp. (ex Dulcina madagascariensis)]